MTAQDERERLQGALAGNAPGAPPLQVAQATTAPIGQQPAPALQSSAPPSPGGNANANGRTPDQSNANESQGGGVDLVKDRGTPDQVIQNMDPDLLVKTVEQSAKAASSESGETGKHSDTPEKKKQANELLKSQGADPSKSIKQMEKEFMASAKKRRDEGEITAEHYTGLKDRWKNIFQIIPKEDFGLFLMDFGMRAMMASETMGSMGAIGAAGSGALEASRGRGQAKTDVAIADQEAARKGALETYKAESGRMQAEASQTTAEASRTRADAIGGGYKGEKAWLLDLGQSMGKTEDEIWDMFNKVKAPEVRRQEFMDFILKAQQDATFTQTDPILGKKYRDFTADDMQDWVEAMVRTEGESAEKANALKNAMSTYE